MPGWSISQLADQLTDKSSVKVSQLDRGLENVSVSQLGS